MSKTASKRYNEARLAAQTKLGMSNIMQVPRITKTVLNIGFKESVSSTKIAALAVKIMKAVAGQTPVRRLALKSIAGFKIREGMPIGLSVTLRGARMRVFLEKLIDLALPKVRDFQGVSKKFDGRGSYNLGIKDCSIFPEAEDAGSNDFPFGMNVTIVTSSKRDSDAFELLSAMKMPFKRT